MKTHTKKRKSIRNILGALLLVIECIAVANSLAVINVYSQEHSIQNTAQRALLNMTTTYAVPVLTSSTAIDVKEEIDRQIEEANRWKGPVLSRSRGSVIGPSGKETYYNLNMSGVVNIMRRMGNTDEYWVRDDGCKMLGDYIMVAANLNLRPRGSLVETSLGTAIVCDTGGFAARNPTQIDVAVNW